jgi:tryptophanyl-tRNA synthetase
MRKLLVSIVLGASLALGGCGGAFSIYKQETIEQMSPVEKAKAGIKQVKAAVTVVVRGAIADRKAGVYNNEEWAELKGYFNTIDKDIKEVEKYLALGDLITAADKRKLVDDAFAYLKAELIKRKE